MRKLLLIILLLPFMQISFGQAKRKVINAEIGAVQYGIASFYADKFEGRLTSSGEKFSQSRLTAAHNTLPLGTWIRVTNLRNRKTVVVKINDRLHHRNTRLVDLSSRAASLLGYRGRGIAKVKVEVLGMKNPNLEEEKSQSKLDK